ncbi:GIY-YIG nuclease family protein [Haloterrigena sp. SYSU A121-1]|uniref:GIY-YIG nuclease family protein n=1 Tax=Haloterrigena gelatinilytica TaxID=2741724 RepID=A0A8J8GJL0_9EURY|nr:GIY-YIG nuclease family protein [Haloterrigena gelatinilytica]NUB91174.1 GIY-YIG nuclease family protein [Haloterrigena gelatinilytica]
MMQSRRNAMHVPDRPGIYKLYTRKANGNLKLVYIGRSTNLRKRVTTHNKPLWDECTFEVVPDEAIRKLMEKHLISEFKPVYNKLEYGDPFDAGREEQALYTFLEEDRFMSLTELADKLGEHPDALEDPINRLCEQGVLESRTDHGQEQYNLSGAVELEKEVANVVDDRFTPSEQEVVGVLVESGDGLTSEEIAERVGKPDKVGSVRKLISDIRKKVELETERDGHYVKYALPDKLRQQFGVEPVVNDAEDVANIVDDRFNRSEREILAVFVEYDDFLSYEELAAKLGRPDDIKAIRSRVSDLSKKIDFETERDGRYVEYKLPEKTRKQVGAAQEISGEGDG